MHILHICEDNKFANLAKQQFEATNLADNTFLINSKKKLNYFPNSKNVICAKPFSKEYIAILKSNINDLIVFHNCNQKYKWRITKVVSQDTKLLWLAWGSDIYNLPKLSGNLYKPLTQKTQEGYSIDQIKIKLDKFIRIILLKYRKQINSYKRINYCAPVMAQDLNILNEKYKLNIHLKKFTYGFLEYYIGETTERISTGNSILVGNSADPSNNHIDTYELLKYKKNTKIISPLSYGGNKKYISSVIKSGNIYFDKNYYPITNFLSLEEYREILYSCKASFMYHQRQQALGNIIMLLWMGVNVYLDEKNPIYNFYKLQGIYVSSINEFHKNPRKDIPALTGEQIQINRKQLQKLYSYKNVIKETKDLIRQIHNSPIPQ